MDVAAEGCKPGYDVKVEKNAHQGRPRATDSSNRQAIRAASRSIASRVACYSTPRSPKHMTRPSVVVKYNRPAAAIKPS